MRFKPLCLLAIVLLLSQAGMAFGSEREGLGSFLSRAIPPRPPGGMTGSEFSRAVWDVAGTERERLILNELMSGNLPEFIRRLAPVHFSRPQRDGSKTDVTIFVMPDYLSIGSDRDYVLIPMALGTAAAVAERFGFVLPTPRIVDAIFRQSAIRLRPEPMPAGSRMRSTPYYVAHDEKVRDQCLALGCTPGTLISGHKKDVVMTGRLAGRQEKVAIYGWHRPSGIPIQPLSTVHGAAYADYSHGIRLVSDTALLNGRPCPIWEIFENPATADILTGEGAVPQLRQNIARSPR